MLTVGCGMARKKQEESRIPTSFRLKETWYWKLRDIEADTGAESINDIIFDAIIFYVTEKERTSKRLFPVCDASIKAIEAKRKKGIK
jgi:hypothetical protein